MILTLKCTDLLLEPRVFFHSDSCSFLLNGLNLGFIPVRSYVYGDFIVRCLAAPFHYSLHAVVAAQCLMGAATAWLLCYCLLTYFGVRTWIAIVCAVVFALDPVQVFHEHAILTETMTMFVAALFLATALYYLKNRQWAVLLGISLLGAVLVSLRVLYVPVVFVAAVALPVIAWLIPRGREKWIRPLAVALGISFGSTLLFQAGYRHLTGYLAGREPAYHYWTGCFLLASVSPIVKPGDARDTRVARVIAESNNSHGPLQFDFRPFQLWSPGGLIDRLRAAFGGDDRLTNSAAEATARAAIRRDPAGFITLGLRTYASYWAALPKLRDAIEAEINNPVSSSDSSVILRFFHMHPVSPLEQDSISAPYYLAAHDWYAFLLVSPMFWLIALFLESANRKAVLFIFTWVCLVFAATCLGAVESLPRYLHPFSFLGIAGAGVIGEMIAIHCGPGNGRRAVRTHFFSRRNRKRMKIGVLDAT